MAMVDDQTHLMQFIRRSFVTGDNTTFCERVIVDENVAAHDVLDLLNEVYSTNRKHDHERHSPDIYMPQRRLGRVANDAELQRKASADGAKAAHRKLTANARFAEQAGVNEHDDAAQAQQTQMAKITLNMDKPSPLEQRTIAQLFAFANATNEHETRQRQSKCTSLLQEANKRSTANPFMQFAKFNAQGRPGTRTYEIFYAFATTDGGRATVKVRSSQKVQVTSDTLVREAIGLSLLLYVQQKREPSVDLCASQDTSKIVDCFELYIADDDGSAELDFPRLEPNDQIGKYDFVRLALVRRATDGKRKSRAKLHELETGEKDLIAERTVRRFDDDVETHQSIGKTNAFDQAGAKRNTRQLSAPLMSPIGAEQSPRNDGSGSGSGSQQNVPTRAPQNRLSLTLSWLANGEPQTTHSRTYSAAGLDADAFPDSRAGAFEFECKLLRSKKLFAVAAVLRITPSTVQIEPRIGTKRNSALWFKSIGQKGNKVPYIYPVSHVLTCKRSNKSELKATLTLTCLVNSIKFGSTRASQPDISLIPSDNALSGATGRSTKYNTSESYSQSRSSIGSTLSLKSTQKTHCLEMAPESAERASSLINHLIERLDTFSGFDDTESGIGLSHVE